MIKIARNGYYLSFFAVVLTTGMLLSPFSSGAANAQKKKDKKNGSPFSDYLNKSETPLDAYEHLKEWSGVNAAEKKKRTAAEIKRWAKNKKALAAEKARSKQNMKRYKKRIQDLKLEASMNERRNAKELKKLSKQKKNVRTKKMQSGEIVKTTSNSQQKAIERAKRKHYEKVERDLKRKRKGVLAENQSRKNRSTAQKAHAEYQLKKEKVRTKNIAKRQNAENVRHNNSKKRSFHEKANTHIGNAGVVLSIIDSAQSSYYEDENGKIHFSAPMYLKNVATNLTGISAVTGTVDAAVNANKWAYNKIIDDYKAKHKCDKVPDYVKRHAESAALKWGGVVGAYNGAKCVPVLGDMIAVGELTEATVGLVHDTAQSNRILAENQVTNQKNRSSAIAKLNAKYEELKACEKEFEKLQARSDKLIVNFESSRDQYVEVFSRSVNREKNFAAADSLTKAAKTAEPYMDDKRIDSLRLNSQKMSAAVMTTIKLARTTLENQKVNGGDPTVLKKTSAELAKMVEVLAEDKKECDFITKALNPLLNGGDIVGNTQELAKETETDSIISSDLYGTARDTLRTHRSLVHKAKLLKQTQAKILQETRALRDHFFKYGDNEIKSTIKMDYKNAIWHQIDDYLIGKLEEKQKTMLFEFNGLRGATQIREDLPPEIAGQVEKAEKLAPIIIKLGDSLDEEIASARQMIARLETQETLPPTLSPTKIPEGKSESIAAKFGNKDFADLSINRICYEVGFYNHVGSQEKKWINGNSLYGFTYHKSNSNEVIGTFNYPNVKSVPIYYGGFTKLIEKGDIEIWNDMNANNKKDPGEVGREPYWIWYKVNGYACNMWGAWYMWMDMKGVEKRCASNLKRLVNINNFTSSNVFRGFTGLLKSDKQYIEGYAYTPPFSASCGLQVFAQVGKFGLWLSKDGTLSKNYKREIGANAFNKLYRKIAFWSTGKDKQLRIILESMLALPKKYVDYSNRHFYNDPHTLLPRLNMTGFHMNNKRDSCNNLYRQYRKKFTLPGSRRTGYVSYAITIRIETPNSSKDSWKDLLRKMPKRISRNRNDWKINIKADSFRASRWHRESYYTTDGSSKKIPLFSVDEQIYAVKSNVVVSIHGHCDNSLTPDLATSNIVNAILAKFTKPPIH